MMQQQATGMMPPNHQQQPLQYHQPPPPQQWMMMPPQQQPPPQQGFQPQPPPAAAWGQQQPPQGPVPTPQHVQHPMMQMQQPQPYAAAQQSPGEVKSLWIGDLLYWMDENYLYSIFGQTGEVTGVKIIKNKQTQQPEGYGFIEFISRAAAERTLLTYNNTLMPNSEQSFRLNWATLGAGERRQDEGPDYTIFVGDLAADVTDYVLQETFKTIYPSVKGAKVVTDRTTGRSKGYGFVRFGDEGEQLRAMTEMNGAICSTRPMRIGPAATKKPAGGQQYQKDAASFPNSQGTAGETDPNNTTIFVGGLDESVTDDQLRQAFGQFGELVHVKIPVGKRCGFVQFSERGNAEQALAAMNGTLLGGQSIRLSWGRSPSNKQAQPDQAQWNSAPYYGYSQGYESYGYAPPPQDPSMYYGAYPGYGNYQQPQK